METRSLKEIKKKIQGMSTDQIAAIFVMAQVPLFIIDHHSIIEAFQNKLQISEELNRLYSQIDHGGGDLPPMPQDMRTRINNLLALKKEADSELTRLTDECLPIVRVI